MNIQVLSREDAEARLVMFFGNDVYDPHKLLLSSDQHQRSIPISTIHSVGNQIFGCLYLPISAFDGEESFSRLVFLQTEETVEVFVADFDETVSPWTTYVDKTESDHTSGSSDQTLLNLIEFAAKEMAKAIEQHLKSLHDNKKLLATSKNRRKETKLKGLAKRKIDLVASKVELKGLNRLLSKSHEDIRHFLIPQLTSQSERLSSSQRSSALLRAHLTMVFVEEWASNASAAMEEVDVLLAQIDSLESEAQTRLGQFVAAVITMGATPLIYLTVFSQLFAEGKRFSSENSVSMLIWGTVLSLGAELLYFKRKRWI